MALYRRCKERQKKEEVALYLLLFGKAFTGSFPECFLTLTSNAFLPRSPSLCYTMLDIGDAGPSLGILNAFSVIHFIVELKFDLECLLVCEYHD